MTIKTNYHERDLVIWEDLPESIQAKYKDDYDWTDEDDLFFVYKGHPYCLSAFVQIDGGYWQAVMGFTAFSGIYVRLSDDGIIVGYFYN